ncbi:MAG: AsmA family protein [Granulosicoccus sp.]
MKTGLIKVGCTVAVLLFGTLASAYIYVHSDAFRQSIAETLSTILGESVELGSELAINSFYPRIEMTLPNAKLRASGTSFALNRARLRNLQLSISHSVLFSGGIEGSVRITADELTLITQSGQSSSAPDSSVADVTSSGQAAMTLSGRFDSLRQKLSGLDVSLSLVDFNYIARNKQAGNSIYRLSNVDLKSLFGNIIRAQASVLEADEVRQTLSLQILAADSDKDTTRAGTFSMDVLAIDDQKGSHKMQGSWAFQGNDLTLSALEYKSDEAWLRGDVAMVFSEQEIGITSELELRQWDIDVGKPTVDTANQYLPPPRLFSYDGFTSSIPKRVNADVSLYLGAVRLDGSPIVNGQLQLKLVEGKLDVSSEDLILLGGAAQVSLQLDNRLEQFVSFNLKLEADDVQLDRIRSSSDNDTMLSRGESDFIVALRGAGPSPGHIASTLDGYVIATVDAAQVNQKYSTLMDVGVVSWAVDRLSLLSKEDDARRSSASLSDPLTIECASLRLYINDGRVEVSNGAIIELPDNVLFSSGFIDLKSETLGFAFRTKSRSIFDWSAISIAKYAEIGGALSAPEITLNIRELAKQGVMSASSMAWGPLPSLVYSLAESGIKNMQSTDCTPQIDD